MQTAKKVQTPSLVSGDRNRKRSSKKTMQNIRLIVFSKFQIVRAALRHLLASAVDIQIIAEPETLQQTEQVIHRLRPDVVLIETVETSTSTIPKFAQKTGQRGRVSLVVLSNQGDARVVREMLRAGVTGYVLKNSSEAELLLAIRSAANGRKFVDAKLIDELVSEGTASRGQGRGNRVLSKRQLQVLTLLVQGYASPAIAKDLHVSVKTVETYRSRIYEKLEVHNRAELMRYAISVGLINLNERSA
jgi:two-component system, NarL family, response regulator NreC